MRARAHLTGELMARCWRAERALTLLVLACMAVGTVAFAGLGLASKTVVDAAVEGDVRLLVLAAVVTAVAYVVDWVVDDVGFTMRMHVVERVAQTDVEPEIMRACTDVDEIDHLERTDFLDRITAVRGRAWAVVDSAWSVVEAAALVLRLALTVALLGSVSPWLLLLVPCAGVQLVLDAAGRRRSTAAEIATSEDQRLQRHLFELGTSPATSKEIRVAGAEDELVARQQATALGVVHARARALLTAAALSTAGWAVFAAGFTAALALVVRSAGQPGGSLGDVVLAVTVGSQLRSVVQQAVGRASDAGGYGRIVEPYLWLRAFAAERLAGQVASAAPPAALTEAITLEHLAFTYPGAARPAVHDVSVAIPAGTVVAVVGEYGSGKTTLVKLLTKLYRPDAGRITVDGTDLAVIGTPGWRAVTSAAFQDFGRYQTTFDEAVGLGDPARMGSDEAVDAAVAAADAGALRSRLPAAGASLLGSRFDGTELSEGQWQKVALARACMRTRPLLFVLDEPTASLDAPSEHEIFARYMERSRRLARDCGAVTVIVSHRFSTVAGADLILVMEQGRLVEHGTHPDLLARPGGVYAELFGIQATAYADS
ncbi:ABC transporter ATP-binding protein [Cellulomonas cellasea]|uniref:ATP-binding cassette subfamily B protein n=1 Tax=Cellulomonas cellasea TaxID=43670 RepID=A0A7W4YAT0_9CELL|nr:ABC transporter ATP-binding protein [Cellulomonas cellasea]MBB2921776.1 ATP-binding cassette subfamily B protein [Cellulomonas cellasea]